MRLLAPVAEESTPEVEEGDGTPRAPQSSSKEQQQASQEDARKSVRQARDLRVWPMRAKTYTFTQPFGCVPQIANFYLPGDGCPPDRPVVHTGIDLAAPEGTPFYAAAAGWVTASGYDREVGVPNTRIIIQHVGRNDGYATEYLHWIASYVKVGDYVEAGQFIGEVGSVGYSTGPHLHFSVVDLNSGEHIDPIGWLPKTPDTKGYRGLAPHTRAQMRLPAGTTAGVPETADPSPPPPPSRQDVPDASPHKSKKHKHKQRKREERRAARASSNKGDQSEDAAGSESGGSSEAGRHHKKAKGKDKERTRTRERNKDGAKIEKSAKGENGSAGKASDGSQDDAATKSTRKSKHDNRGGRRGAAGHDSSKHRREDNNRGGRKNGEEKKSGSKKRTEGSNDGNSGGAGDAGGGPNGDLNGGTDDGAAGGNEGDSGDNPSGEPGTGRPAAAHRDRSSTQRSALGTGSNGSETTENEEPQRKPKQQEAA